MTSRATSTGTGITVGATASAVWMVTYQNIAGTITFSNAPLLIGNQYSQAAMTPPVLTVSASGNVITFLVTNQALCTTDSTIFGHLYAS